MSLHTVTLCFSWGLPKGFGELAIGWKMSLTICYKVELSKAFTCLYEHFTSHWQFNRFPTPRWLALSSLRASGSPLSINMCHLLCLSHLFLFHFPLSFITPISPLLPHSLFRGWEEFFRHSEDVCHDVIAVATRQTVSRYTQMHQAPDLNPIKKNTHAGPLSFLKPLQASHFIRNTNAWS